MDNKRLVECTNLAEEILRNIELAEQSLSNVILKSLRLCRLLGDERGVKFFTFESGGYLLTIDGNLTSESWEILKLAGRTHLGKNPKGEPVTYADSWEHVAALEEEIIALRIRLESAKDPNISLSSSNTYQHVHAPAGNGIERQAITDKIRKNTLIIGKVKGNVYEYILNIYNELKYGNVIEDIFIKNRGRVDSKLAELCPDAIKKFIAVYDNINSNNPENWANAVHSCRRILNDVADALYPSSEIPIERNGKQIKIGKDQYINRLIDFIQGKTASKTYQNVVGADLRSIGERLDSINEAVCKGTHSEVNEDEATRYIIHTYLLLSDIISLLE